MANTGEANELQQREQEAEAFLASITPSLVAHSTAHTSHPSASAKIAGTGEQNGHGGSQTVGGSLGASLAINIQRIQAEEMRQNALKRIKATHRSIKQDPVIVSGGTTAKERRVETDAWAATQTKVAVPSASPKHAVVAGIRRPSPFADDTI